MEATVPNGFQGYISPALSVTVLGIVTLTSTCTLTPKVIHQPRVTVLTLILTASQTLPFILTLTLILTLILTLNITVYNSTPCRLHPVLNHNRNTSIEP